MVARLLHDVLSDRGSPDINGTLESLIEHLDGKQTYVKTRYQHREVGGACRLATPKTLSQKLPLCHQQTGLRHGAAEKS